MIKLLLKILCILFFIQLFPATNLFAGKKERIKIKTVALTGNVVFSDRQIYSAIFSRPSRFLNASYYYPQLLLDDLSNIESYYRYNGYLEAKVTEFDVRVDTLKHQCNIRINIFEGSVTLVDSLSISGNQVFTDDFLIGKLKISQDKPLARKYLQFSTEALLTTYADSGYLDAVVEPVISVDSTKHRATVLYKIQEMNKFTFGKTYLNGLVKTRPAVVRRELNYKPGQTANMSKILASQRNLYMTSLFQSVFFRPVTAASEDSSRKDIYIDLKENKYREFNFAVGYGSLERARSRIEIIHTNWRGTAQKLGLSGDISFIRHGLEASFTEPRTFGSHWRTDIVSGIAFEKNPGYDIYKYGGRTVFGRRLSRAFSTSISFRNEIAYLRNVKLTDTPADIDTDVRSLILAVAYDTRDDMLDPVRGFYSQVENEFAGLLFRGSNTFFRTIFISKGFYSLTPSTVAASSFEIGWMVANVDLPGISPNERFYAGGPNSLRGFEYQHAGPLDVNNVPIGGRMKIVMNLVELRQTIYKNLKGTLFLDAGNVWKSPVHFNFTDFRLTPGAGIRISTPLGLARLDYGFIIDPRNREKTGQLYFGIGHAF